MLERYCCPRGCAFLWARPEHHSTLHPLVVSHGSGDGLTSSFVWDGNRDYSATLAVLTAIRVWRMWGNRGAREYMLKTARSAAESLSAAWGTDVLAPWDMCGAMVMVRLPAACAGLDEGDEAYPAHAKFVQDALFHTYGVRPLFNAYSSLVQPLSLCCCACVHLSTLKHALIMSYFASLSLSLFLSLSPSWSHTLKLLSFLSQAHLFIRFRMHVSALKVQSRSSRQNRSRATVRSHQRARLQPCYRLQSSELRYIHTARHQPGQGDGVYKGWRLRVMQVQPLRTKYRQKNSFSYCM